MARWIECIERVNLSRPVRKQFYKASFFQEIQHAACLESGDTCACQACMKTAQPAYSNSFDEFPGMVHKWGLSFDINTQSGPYGRSAGSVSWAGLLNCYFWLDPV
jgi:hypothetical protein